MHICFFESSLGVGRGEYFVDLANALSNESEVESFSLVAPKGVLYKDRLSSKIKLFEYLDLGSRYNVITHIKLLKLFKLISADVVHTHFAKSTEIFRRINWIIDCAWCSTKHNPRKGTIFSKVPNVVAVSNVVRESIKSRNSITVITNGIDANPCKVFDLPNVFSFLTVGRLVKVKAYDRLIKSLALLNNRGYEFHLRLVGDGPERRPLEELVCRVGLTNKITFCGMQTNVREYMRSSHVLLVSSLSEGFSLTMVEAMFYSPLMLTTPVGGVCELLSEEFILNTESMHLNLAKAIKNYDEMSKRFLSLAKKNRPQLAMSTAVSKHIEFYKSIM